MNEFIPLTQGRVAIVDSEDYEGLVKYKWLFHGGYARRNEGGRTIHMHRIIIDCPDGLEVDHINRDGLDNRKSNLRLATRSQNLYNRSNYANSSSQYKGVTWNVKGQVWQASIRTNRRLFFLGAYDSEEVAAAAYNHYAKKFFGDFALLNDVEDADFRKLRVLKRKGKSKYKGVTQNYLGKWVARIGLNGRRRFLGSFDTQEEAAQAYNDAFKKIRNREDVPNAL